MRAFVVDSLLYIRGFAPDLQQEMMRFAPDLRHETVILLLICDKK